MKFTKHKSHLFSLERKYIFPFCLIDFITSILFFYANNLGHSPAIIYHLQMVYLGAEIILLPTYMNSVMGKETNYTYPGLIIVFATIVSFYASNFTADALSVFNGLYITFYCIKYIKWLLTQETIYQYKTLPHFWIVFGTMLCYTSTIPTSLAHYILRGKFGDITSAFLLLFFIYNSVMHLFFIKAVKCKPTSPQTSPSS